MRTALSILIINLSTVARAFHSASPSSAAVRWSGPSSLLAGKSSPQELRQQAESLRKDIDEFENKKKAAEEEEERAIRQAQAEKEAVRERYSAIVPILKPDGSTQEERCDFRPRHTEGASYITTVEANLPLGIILGESEIFAACTVVDEVKEDSNGFVAGVQVGDILHACTATKVEMEMPTWQLLAGGIGVPKTKRFMYQAEGRPFEEVMEAVGSNRQDPEERPVLLVVERLETP